MHTSITWEPEAWDEDEAEFRAAVAQAEYEDEMAMDEWQDEYEDEAENVLCMDGVPWDDVKGYLMRQRE